MAVGSDKDKLHKGQELWKALKDPLDRRRIQDLIIDGAPTNFREPGTEVKCVNLFSFELICVFSRSRYLLYKSKMITIFVQKKLYAKMRFAVSSAQE